MLATLLLAGALAGPPLAPSPIAVPPRHPVDLEAISALKGVNAPLAVTGQEAV
jgi:hypothetical protein